MSLPSSDIVLYYVVTLTVSFVLQSKKHRTFVRCFFLTSDYLSSRNVSIQVLSAFEGLTTVFGMGTGGTPQLSSLDSYEDTFAPSKLHRRSFHSLFYAFLSQVFDLLVSVRSIPHGTSTPDLSTLSSSRGLISFRWRNFILRLVSRLDAFSVYPFRT